MDLSPPRSAILGTAFCTGLLFCASLLATQVSGASVHARTASSSPGSGPSPQDVRFNRDVRPLLADRCFACHGPDEHARKGQLRLDSSHGPEGALRSRGGTQAIQPGSLDGSELWYRLTTDDTSDVMPPADSHKEALNAAELDIIRRWIEQGARYEEHWAFIAPTQPAAPDVEDQRWNQQPIDRFVARKLEEFRIQPSPRADKRTLIRRLSFDVTGLPPTRAEIQAFLSDATPGCYERLVDRLLAQPQFGEHMAKYWLDLVRFADTNGVHHDHYREMTHYRDWVIRSWNDNLPYDQFVTDQLAGDLYPEVQTDDQLIASGIQPPAHDHRSGDDAAGGEPCAQRHRQDDRRQARPSWG